MMIPLTTQLCENLDVACSDAMIVVLGDLTHLVLKDDDLLSLFSDCQDFIERGLCFALFLMHQNLNVKLLIPSIMSSNLFYQERHMKSFPFWLCW